MPNGWIDPDNYGPHTRQWLGHTFRYYLAAGFLRPEDEALDAGCGVGYGSAILAEKCHQVLAYDADIKALNIAARKHGLSNISYRGMNFDEIEVLPPVDVAVSFETIEHLQSHPSRFAKMLKRCAKRLIVISTPVIPTVGVNPHHLHDFTEQSFQSLFFDDDWTLWEFVRQGPYGVLVVYRK